MNAQTPLLLTLLLSLLCGCTRAPQESTAPRPALDPIAAMTLPTPVFDLAAAPLDPAQAAQRGIICSIINDLCLLEFTNAGPGITYNVPGLPRDAAPRTLLVTVRPECAAPAVLAGYGAAGAIGHMCALNIDHAVRYSFWGYGADIWCAAPVRLSKWACLVVVFDGRLVTLYLDGVETATGAHVLRTPLTPMLIGEKFVGVISDVRVWNTAMDATQVAAATATSLAKLR